MKMTWEQEKAIRAIFRLTGKTFKKLCIEAGIRPYFPEKFMDADSELAEKLIQFHSAKK